MRMRVPRCVFVLSLACSAVAAQQASFSTFGQGCGVHGEPPQRGAIWGTGLPRLGSTVTVGYTGPTFAAHVFSHPILITGLSRTSMYGVALPYHLDWWRFSWIGGPDCYLYCSSDVFLPPSGQGPSPGRVTMTIPNDPSMLGRPVYQQWYVEYAVPRHTLYFAITTDCAVWTIGI